MKSGLLAVALLTVAAACSSSSGGGTKTPPAAPSTLGVAPLGGGAHLTWTDNATDEDGFVVMRKNTGGTYALLATTPFDIVTYHDDTVSSGSSYVYEVYATNGAGASAFSNEATIAVP